MGWRRYNRLDRNLGHYYRPHRRPHPLRQQRMTGLEKRFQEFTKEADLDFKFTGNGTHWIGDKNPDFINRSGRVAVEVFHPSYKIKNFGSVDNYVRQRDAAFKSKGVKALFLSSEDMKEHDWKQKASKRLQEIMEKYSTESLGI
ncbi:MAG: hypothetical protein HY519_04175 [Candidatus Aenigmarchaeota archaeon]|nr:hypothetical protein [Candidatus Aenigmarchaeota archaeon]